MELSHLAIADLQAVAAVAEHAHFGRAAQALRLAQPTLSARVQKFERMLGATLFERSAHRFLITPDGQRLLPLIRETLAAAERLGASAEASVADEARRPLRLGVIPTLGPYLMPHLLLPLRRRRGHPIPELQITEQTTHELVDALLDGTLDAALLSMPIRNDSLECFPLFDEPFRLVAPHGAPILNTDRLVPSRLCACDMILLEEGHCLRDQAIAVCSKRGGASPRLVTTSLETLKYMVAAGAGYSLLPALAASIPKGLGELVRLRDFDERTPSRRVALCVRRAMSRRAGALDLADFIRAQPPPGVSVVPGGANERRRGAGRS